MNKGRFYKLAIGFLLALILVMGLIFFLKKRPVEPLKLPPEKVVKHVKKKAGKIAIVIDDVGYTLSNLGIIESLKYPLTFSILPGLDFSKSAAEDLNSRGFQIILHLPMEPKDNRSLEADTILVSMDEAQVRSIINKDLTAIPKLKGVSNHMGSKVTEDEKTMSVVLDELKKRNMFFLDSFVTANSVAKQLAAQKKLRFVQRDVFLDNSSEPEYIRQQINQLKQKALKNGQAVGIGHDRKATLEVLREEIPKMAKEGFRFVFVSDLAR
ncbi:MAG: divergent polysaccharide deacetylase family protein [Candidatus Omnitrophota bacterium]